MVPRKKRLFSWCVWRVHARTAAESSKGKSSWLPRVPDCQSLKKGRELLKRPQTITCNWLKHCADKSALSVGTVVSWIKTAYYHKSRDCPFFNTDLGNTARASYNRAGMWGVPNTQSSVVRVLPSIRPPWQAAGKACASPPCVFVFLSYKPQWWKLHPILQSRLFQENRYRLQASLPTSYSWPQSGIFCQSSTQHG
jgi:hypothetical protein